MSASFVERLKKDFKKSPGKAIALGLLCLVAVWFWVPLIFGGGSAPTLKPATKPSAKTTATESTTAVKSKDTFVAPPWRSMTAWIAADSRYRPQDATWRERDPFTKLVEAKPVVAKATPKVAEVDDVSPTAARIALGSTLVGNTRKVALINGKSYHVGDTIRGDFNKNTVKFTLTKIEPKQVTLSRQGHDYVLKIRQVDVLHREEEEVESDVE